MRLMITLMLLVFLEIVLLTHPDRHPIQEISSSARIRVIPMGDPREPARNIAGVPVLTK